jgi:hypothetical protein
MDREVGQKLWVIPDMYWPEITSEGHYVSHEAICVLNTGNQDCLVEITCFFQDREPVVFPEVECKARRTNHIRMDALNPTLGLSSGLPYASVVRCSVPVVVQYTRVDTTQSENAIMTTMAYGANN